MEQLSPIPQHYYTHEVESVQTKLRWRLGITKQQMIGNLRNSQPKGNGDQRRFRSAIEFAQSDLTLHCWSISKSILKRSWILSMDSYASIFPLG